MNVELFCKQIATNKNREDYLKSRLIKNYVSYEEKVSVCERIVEATSYVEVNGQKIYKRNMPSRAVFFTLKLIDEYTDIDIDFNNILKDYNKLDEEGFVEILLKTIPAKEVSTWRTILEMIEDDQEVNERTMVSFLSAKSEAAQMMINSLFESIEKAQITEE